MTKLPILSKNMVDKMMTTMFDITNFTFPQISEITPIIGEFVVGGMILLIFIFSFQLIQQVRLLNRFLHTQIASAWLGLSVALFLLTIITGVWFLLA